MPVVEKAKSETYHHKHTLPLTPCAHQFRDDWVSSTRPMRGDVGEDFAFRLDVRQLLQPNDVGFTENFEGIELFLR